jgi:YHS domain-containing protein
MTLGNEPLAIGQLKKQFLCEYVTGMNRSSRQEAPRMKRFLRSLTTASIGAVVVLAATNAFGISGEQTLLRARNMEATVPKLLGQNAFLEEEKDNATAKLNVDSQGVILKGCDVVAYFKEGKPVKGSSAIASTYRGATYLFGSAANKAEFEKDPAKYVPQYGGFCAYGVASGVLADPEGPSAFIVYKGKLYICGNQGALKSFKSDIDSNIDKAEKNWRQLTGS